MKKILHKSRAGFTLIELLIVIVIIGILSVAFLPTVLNAPKKARDAAKMTNINLLVTALESYALENNGKFPTDIATLKSGVNKYFKNSVFPTDIAGDIEDGIAKIYQYKGKSDGSCYRVGAKFEVYDKKLYKGNTYDCTTAPAISAKESEGTWYYQYSLNS